MVLKNKCSAQNAIHSQYLPICKCSAQNALTVPAHLPESSVFKVTTQLPFPPVV